MNAQSNRLPALDGVRGIAILLVMQLHFWNWMFLFGDPAPTAAERFVNDVFQIGWVGVDLFFVLSGFLITGILLDAKGSGGYFRAFWARRTLRILPITFTVLGTLFLIAPRISGFGGRVQADISRDDQWWFWTFTYNIGSSFRNTDFDPAFVHSHFWSLAVEEQFYLLWPLAVFALNRKYLAGFCLLLIVAAFSLRVAIVCEWPYALFTNFGFYHFTLARMDTLAFGALIAISSREGWLPRLDRYAPFVAALACSWLVLLFALRDGFHPLDDHVAIAGYIAIALFFSALLVCLLVYTEDHDPPGWLTNPFLLAFGQYSFCLYLIHPLVMALIGEWIDERGWIWTPGGSRIPFNIVFSIVATGVSLFLAFLSWQLVEKRFLDLKSRFQYGLPVGGQVEELYSGRMIASAGVDINPNER